MDIHVNARHLADQWTNGNCEHVIEALAGISSGLHAAAITSLMFAYLEQSDLESFRRRLETEAEKRT